MKITSILAGFKVEKAAPGTLQFGDYGSEIAYTVTGKRGAVYVLIRYGGNSSIMFLRNSKGNDCAISGYTRFSDHNGELTTWTQFDEARAMFGNYPSEGK